MAHQCSCGDSHNNIDQGAQSSLYNKIDKENIECLNECEEGSGVFVFKPLEDKLDRNKYVESDVDNELLFNIPFTGNVKLKGLIIIGGEDDLHPNKVKLYKNRQGMTFDDVGTEPEQELELHVDPHGVHEYPLKVVKFSSVQHLSLYFTGSPGSDKIRIYYIQLKGEWTPGHQQGVVICNYELHPQMSDHPKDHEDIDRAIS
ncbi:PITH domain-containing protein GA19395 [Anthophora quadrimaculata]